MKKFRLISLLLAAVLLCTVFAGCSGKQPLSSDTVLMTINGKEVTVEEYRTYYLYLKAQYDSGDDSYWKNNASDKETLKVSTLSQLQNRYAIEAILDENNITLTDADQENVDEQLESLKDYYGAESYQQVLTDNYYTEESYREAVELSQRQCRYIYETQKEAIQENYVRAKHILIAFDDTADDEEADKAEKLEKANEIAALAKAGADFDELVAEYGEDPGMEDNLDGYDFTTGEMVESFETTTFALEENEISDPVESTYGYHIILRLPMDEQYIINNLSSLLDSEYYTDLSAAMTEAVAAQTVEYTDAYDDIDIATIQ